MSAEFEKFILNPGNGWRPWSYSPPRGLRAVEAIRRGWEFPQTLVVSEIDPHFNIANLYWREIP